MGGQDGTLARHFTVKTPPGPSIQVDKHDAWTPYWPADSTSRHGDEILYSAVRVFVIPAGS